MLSVSQQTKRSNSLQKISVDQTEKLPNISHSPYKPATQNQEQFNHRSSPLRKSFSMSAILHGDNSNPGGYYIDELERFRRNHDAKNKEQREAQKQVLIQKLQNKRKSQLQRQDNFRKREQQNLRLMIDKNTQILETHKHGLVRNNTFNNSIPVNPITLKYQQNVRGRYQKQADKRAEVRKLVRGHHLQTMGTSGYNIINGVTVDRTSQLLSKNKSLESIYEQKLQKFYANFRIKPPSLQEFQNNSAKKS